MAPSLRRVRRKLREYLLRNVEAGDGNNETLHRVAEAILGTDVGYRTVLKTFIANEVNKALAQLRCEGLVESTGGKWKPTQELNVEDATVITQRRKKRLRGELKAHVRLCHEHGLVEDAVLGNTLLAAIDQSLMEENLNKQEAVSTDSE